MILTDSEKRDLFGLVQDIRDQQEGHNNQDSILNAPESLLTKLEAEAQ